MVSTSSAGPIFSSRTCSSSKANRTSLSSQQRAGKWLVLFVKPLPMESSLAIAPSSTPITPHAAPPPLVGLPSYPFTHTPSTLSFSSIGILPRAQTSTRPTTSSSPTTASPDRNSSPKRSRPSEQVETSERISRHCVSSKRSGLPSDTVSSLLSPMPNPTQPQVAMLSLSRTTASC